MSSTTKHRTKKIVLDDIVYLICQLVPEDVAEDTYNKMSPRYVNFYKKSGEAIFKFNHETLKVLGAR